MHRRDRARAAQPGPGPATARSTRTCARTSPRIRSSGDCKDRTAASTTAAYPTRCAGSNAKAGRSRSPRMRPTTQRRYRRLEAQRQRSAAYRHRVRPQDARRHAVGHPQHRQRRAGRRHSVPACDHRALPAATLIGTMQRLTAAVVVHELEPNAMPRVGGRAHWRDTTFQCMAIEPRKERIGVLHHRVHVGQVQPVGQRQASVRRFRRRRSRIALQRLCRAQGPALRPPTPPPACPRTAPRPTGQHQIAPARQRTAQRLRRLAAHQQRLAQRQRLEALEVVRQTPGQVVVAPIARLRSSAGDRG